MITIALRGLLKFPIRISADQIPDDISDDPNDPILQQWLANRPDISLAAQALEEPFTIELKLTHEQWQRSLRAMMEREDSEESFDVLVRDAIEHSNRFAARAYIILTHISIPESNESMDIEPSLMIYPFERET